MRHGTSEPVIEKHVLAALGIKRLKPRTGASHDQEQTP
jgi:sulfide:quinone oxidoreductase